MTSSIQKLIDGEIFIEVNGIKHWVKVAGVEHATTPLVIIHGGPGGNHYNFERTIGPLLEQFATVIYYEQRGCGRSEAPSDESAYSISLLLNDLDLLRQQLGLHKIIPLGYSFGGELALHYATTYPNSIEKVIVEAPSTGNWLRQYSTQMWGFESIATGELKQRIRDLISDDASLKDRYSTLWSIVDSDTVDRFLFHNKEVGQLNRKLWKEGGLKNTGLMAKVIFEESQPYTLLNRVSSIQLPVLTLVGLYDRNIGLESIRDMIEPIENAKMVVFEQSAHFPDMEEPHKYAAVVKEFLK